MKYLQQHEVWNTIRNGQVDFRNCIIENIQFPTSFPGSVSFAGSRFVEMADFSGTHFYGKADFTGVIFEKGFKAYESIFHQSTSFAYCRFINLAIFWRARFLAFTDFSEAVVCPSNQFDPSMPFRTGEANFSWAWFQDEVRFSRVQFFGPVYFWRTLFFSRTFFENTVFKNEVYLNGTISEVIIPSGDLFLEQLIESNILRRSADGPYYHLNYIHSEEELRERLSNVPLLGHIINWDWLIHIWQTEAKPMFANPDEVYFTAAIFENPAKVFEEKINIRIKSKILNSGFFISYSHKDKKWKDEVRIHLKVFEDLGYEVWEDNLIGLGDEWEATIDSTIKRAKAAILLISKNFLSSDFIKNKELLMLENACNRGLKLFWILVEDCDYGHTFLNKLQSAYTVSKPLKEVKPHKRNVLLQQVVYKMAETIGVDIAVKA